MFTLLHISDLHRSPSDPIENSTLLSSLLSDMDRQKAESNFIPKPDAAIVSGDIIQGVSLDFSGYADELKRQYDVAFEFLSALAGRMFNGDHSKIIISPGNHDICWNTAKSSMRELVESTPKKVNANSFSSDSLLRWDWNTRKIFEISNQDLYKRRLDAYWNFIERFYRNVDLIHPLDSSRGFNLFSLDNGRILVAALESIHGNDCFCRQGSVERSILGACALAIRDLPQQPILKVATWHHSFQGPPAGDDYMDISTIYELIGLGFRVGLHGHQHLAEANAHTIHLPEEESMAISSAASLCAGKRELPTGVNRGYNLVVIDDDYASCRVHVRESIQGNQFGRYTRGIFKIDGFANIRWTQTTLSPTTGSSEKSRFDSLAILRAEDFLQQGNAKGAMEILEGVNDFSHEHTRYIYLQAARAINDNHAIIKFIGEPNEVNDLIELLGALMRENCLVEAEKLLNSDLSSKLDRNTFDQLKDQLAFKIRFGIKK